MKFGVFPRTALHWAAAMTVVFVASGCGKIGSNDSPDKRSTVDLAEAQRSAQLTQISCFSDGDCNPSVAMIAAAWSVPSPGVSVCTGFLVAPDILATNSHCLPVDLDHAGSSCSQRIWAFFPTMSSAQEERLECDTVISSTGNSETVPQQDIAFLRLKTRSSRPALQLSRDGFPDKAKVKLVKVNPEPGQGGGYDVGTMQTVECEAEQHSTRLPSFDDSHSPVVALGTCEVLHGNSGSPLIDSQGRAVGIIQAFFNPSSIDPNSLLTGSINRLNVATSMACVQSPVDVGGTYSSACNNMPGTDDDRHAKDWLDSVSRKLQQDADSSLAIDESNNPTGIRWKARSLDQTSTVIPEGSSNTQYDSYLVPIPECVAATPATGSMDRTILIIHYRRGYDENLVPSYRTVVTTGITGRLSVTPARRGYYVELQASDSQGHQIQLFQGTIDACR